MTSKQRETEDPLFRGGVHLLVLRGCQLLGVTSLSLGSGTDGGEREEVEGRSSHIGNMEANSCVRLPLERENQFPSVPKTKTQVGQDQKVGGNHRRSGLTPNSWPGGWGMTLLGCRLPPW